MVHRDGNDTQVQYNYYGGRHPDGILQRFSQTYYKLLSYI